MSETKENIDLGMICSGCKRNITNFQISEIIEIQGYRKYFCVDCEEDRKKKGD